MELNRRDFLKGAALSGAATAVVGLAGCSPQNSVLTSGGDSTPITSVNTGGPSWLTPPPVPDATLVKEEHDCEILVVGTGAAGNCAVLAATEAGAKVIGIDKGSADETPYVPNSRD
ncbi:MAG: twin-arginine translocation signal domain-containing protein, partial [Coriobacteriales bacterium]|nr:twin-arginine translocation signal domain-containing protein [Coriobacteriales bacterium]